MASGLMASLSWLYHSATTRTAQSPEDLGHDIVGLLISPRNVMGYGYGYELVFVPADLGQFLAQLRPIL